MQASQLVYARIHLNQLLAEIELSSVTNVHIIYNVKLDPDETHEQGDGHPASTHEKGKYAYMLQKKPEKPQGKGDKKIDEKKFEQERAEREKELREYFDS